MQLFSSFSPHARCLFSPNLYCETAAAPPPAATAAAVATLLTPTQLSQLNCCRLVLVPRGGRLPSTVFQGIR